MEAQTVELKELQKAGQLAQHWDKLKADWKG
jgi:hypothetical protein